MRLSFVVLCTAIFACHSSPQPKADSMEGPPPGEKAGAPSQTGAPPAKAGEPQTGPSTAPTTSATATAKPAPRAIDESAMDKSADPCGDFYQYACGGWLKSTPIPPDRSVWGRGFSEIAQRNEAMLRDILEANAKGEADAANPFWKKTGDFYASCMDEAKAGKNGLAELKRQLGQLAAIDQPQELARTVARLHARGAWALFTFRQQQDFKDATQMIGGADQGGLGLPDRDYYLKADAREAGLRKAYEEHIARMFALVGDRNPPRSAHVVMEIETALAKASMDKVERRDPAKVYHRLDRAGLAAKAPHFAWDAYFAEAGVPSVTAINVAAPGFFEGLDKLLAERKPAELRKALEWRVIQTAAPMLDAGFVAESFRLKQALSGEKEDLPRWKKCVAMTDGAFGEALGRSFVAKALGEAGKARAKTMIEEIEGAFRTNLDAVAWMEEPARVASREKVQKLFNMIGFPDKWRDYSTVQVSRDNLYANALAAVSFERARRLAFIGKPVDKTEWNMSPPTVNAYYQASQNEMVFPAGIMQPPFFSPDAPDSANYGGLGMVMGHELTHGFDDRGRQFDGDGNFREWWTSKTTAAYKERAECVAKQYDGYVAVNDVHLNGHLTLGENIADIGGIKLALAAYRTKNAAATNDDVRDFFVAFAQTWCTNARPEAAELRAKTDPHSSPRWRVNGPLSDNPDFEKAFSCKAGSPMVPANRCTVW